ncbi:hypothetical protein A3Q56_03296 [Intoshia linei]|uniref:EGF-like domain-containing protein n=1 Tax=Intoshia linei TaxID=1819745 RepID=A0A177B5Q2_9BILA|nr:hypothetical protein A3Q56_03296 [Intoshia linei]
MFYLPFIDAQTKCSITNCADCLNVDLKCEGCSPKYYMDNSTALCKSCIGNCDACSAKASCTKCSTKYFYDTKSTACIECVPKCDSCPNALNCDACSSGNFKVTAGVKCFSCSSNCMKCRSNTDCTMCATGYYLNAKACIQCPTKCDSCSAAASCTTCAKDYYWDTVSLTCLTCGVNCASGSCSQSNGCTKCNVGYLIDNKKCRKCETLTSTSCPKCLTSTFGHFWNTNVCSQCTANCLSCTSTTTCGITNVDSCSSGFAFDSTTTTCKACSTYATVKTGLNSKAASCHKCPGFFHATTCQACTTAVETQTKCERCADNANSYVRIGYWATGYTCKAVDCTNTVVATALGSEVECVFCSDYFFSTTCQKMSTAEGCASTTVDIEGLAAIKCKSCDNRVLSDGSKKTCHRKVACTGSFDHADKALHCGHYVSATSCLPIDCDNLAGLNTLAKCTGCVNRYWDAATTSCKMINCYDVDAVKLLTVESMCFGCRRVGFYYDGTKCAQLAINQCTTSATQKICESCEGFKWTTSCVAEACTGAINADKCTSCYGTVYASSTHTAVKCAHATGNTAASCLGRTNAAGATFFAMTKTAIIGSCTNANIIARLFYDYVFESNACAFRASVCSYHDDESHCSCSNRVFAVGVKCVGMTCGKTELNAILNIDVRKTAAVRCGILKKGVYVHTDNLAYDADCTDVTKNVLEPACISCPKAYWDAAATVKCIAVICSDQPLNTAVKCNSCTNYYAGSGNTCYKCPQYSSACTATGATCNANYVFDSATWTCKAATCTGTLIQATCAACDSKFWDGTACQLCPDNCLTCTSATTCTKCKDTFVFSSTESSCVSCYASSATPCDQCSTTTIGKYYVSTTKLCLPCAALSMATIADTAVCSRCGPVLSSKAVYWSATASPKCQMCIANCNKCSDSIGCSECASGRYLKAGASGAAGSCDACITDCSSCGDATSCSTCVSGTYYDSSASPASCKKCPTDCTLCSVAKKCDKCVTNKYADVTTGVCGACITNCATCDTNTPCIKCNSAYFLNAAKTPNVCEACPSNCKTCTSGTVCTECNSSFCLNQNKLCSASANKCKTCTVSAATPAVVSCLDCVVNHVLDICNACSANCLTCTSATKCTACAKATYLSTDVCKACGANCETCTADTNCSKCTSKTMFFDVAAKACKVCDANCISCIDATKCGTCGKGYFVKADKCVACPTNCVACSSADTCNTCKTTGMNFDATKKSCVECGPLCKTCSNSTVCSHCEASGYMDTAAKPIACKNCVDSITNCLTCGYDVAGTVLLCKTCKAGYTLKEDGKSCVACSSGCKSCIDPKPICKTCSTGFIPSFKQLNCGAKSCFLCDTLKGANCTSGAANFTHGGCPYDCLIEENLKTKRMFRGCSKGKCTPENKIKMCKTVKNITVCERCCDTPLCNHGGISSSFNVAYNFFIVMFILILNVQMGRAESAML